MSCSTFNVVKRQWLAITADLLVITFGSSMLAHREALPPSSPSLSLLHPPPLSLSIYIYIHLCVSVCFPLSLRQQYNLLVANASPEGEQCWRLAAVTVTLPAAHLLQPAAGTGSARFVLSRNHSHACRNCLFTCEKLYSRPLAMIAATVAS